MSKIQEKINIDNKQAVRVPLNKLRINEQNPRYISEEKFTKLVTSLLVFPEMLELRPIVADKDGVILGGNMRLRALIDISSKQISDITALMEASRDYDKKSAMQKQALIAFWTDWLTTLSVPVVYAGNLTKEQRREFIIKDKASFGGWNYDILANDWNVDDLAEWGVDDLWKDDNDISTVDLWGDDSDASDADVAGSAGVFAITFVFADKYRQIIDDYIREHGKEPITQKIIELCQNPEVR